MSAQQFFNTLSAEDKESFAKVSKHMLDTFGPGPQPSPQPPSQQEQLEYILQMIRSGILASDLSAKEIDTLYSALGPDWEKILYEN